MSFEGVPYGKLKDANYTPRVIDERVSEDIEDFGAVCLEGAKYCGKTWTGRAFSNSELDLMDPAGNFQNLEAAMIDPASALEGAGPRLIDEWQEVPMLWDGVRNKVDRTGKRDRFVLTGSSVPKKKAEGGKWDAPMHSGVGRIAKLRMRPMSLYESGESNGTVSLKDLFQGGLPSSQAPGLALSDLCELVVRGGWPAAVGRPSGRAQRVIKGYVEEVCQSDLTRVDGVRREPEKVIRLLHSLARNAEQATKSKTIIADMTETAADGPLAPDTVTDYLGALKRVFVIEEIGGWAPRLRSPLRINKRPKYHFVDPSFPAAILGATRESLSRDLESLGFMFECLCVRDLLIYAEAMDAKLMYYRDQAGLEADVVIEAADGDWAAIEIKLGHSQADKAAKNLKSVSEKVQAAGAKPPAFLAVVEGLGGYAYRREDGVLVVPIATLAP